MRLPAGSNTGARSAATRPLADVNRDNPPLGLLEGELLDLYGAILIVVPVALFLKSLWT
jgi:hypothetical protein